MHLRNLNSVNKNSILLVFFTFMGGVSFTQVMVNPKSVKAENSVILSKEQQENNEKILKENDKNAFPIFVDTGNPAIDNENYSKAKNDWISKNTLRYEQMISGFFKQVFSKTEFNSFSEVKRAEILAHPEKFIVE